MLFIVVQISLYCYVFNKIDDRVVVLWY